MEATHVTQELQVQEKREVEKKPGVIHPRPLVHAHRRISSRESTPSRVVVEMPGVDKNNVDISIEAGALTIDGRVGRCCGLTPLWAHASGS